MQLKQYLDWLISLKTEDALNDSNLVYDYEDIRSFLKSYMETFTGTNTIVDDWKHQPFPVNDAAIFLDALSLLKHVLEMPITFHTSSRTKYPNIVLVHAKAHLPKSELWEKRHYSKYVGKVDKSDKDVNYDTALASLKNEQKIRLSLIENIINKLNQVPE